MSYVPELRASLVRAAELRGAARAAGPPGPAPRRRRWFGEFGTAVAAGVAVAIVFVGHVRQGASNGGVGAPGAHLTVPPPPPPPNPTSGQWSLIVGARRATAARDRACSPFVTVPRLSPGAPGPALTSILGVLRRPPSAADSIPREFFQPLRGIYLAAIRRARYVDGVGLYVVPTANLFGWRPVPARCRSEEAAALQREARSSGALQVAAALDVQRRYLNWEQYEARHPEGICVAELDPRGAVGEACGWGVGEIEQGLAGLGGTDIPGPGLVHGIVPDGVTSVTLELTGGRAAVDARVVNNMYLARLPHGVNMPARILWRAADGRVLKTTRMP
jgi:hypothetical protein